jgi:hypothetical protein
MSKISHIQPPTGNGVFVETMEGQLNTVGGLLHIEIEKLENLYEKLGGSLVGKITISQIYDPNQEPSADDPMDFLFACTARLRQTAIDLEEITLSENRESQSYSENS